MCIKICRQSNKMDETTPSNPEEYQYLNIIQKIISVGTWEEGRNGRTKSIFGEMMRFSLANGQIPILTTKRTAWKTCLRELLWFIRGETDNRLLQEQGVHIWDGNTTREFLDSRGLNHYREGLIGPGYGFQWRHFGGEYDAATGKCLDKGSRNSLTTGLAEGSRRYRPAASNHRCPKGPRKTNKSPPNNDGMESPPIRRNGAAPVPYDMPIQRPRRKQVIMLNDTTKLRRVVRCSIQYCLIQFSHTSHCPSLCIRSTRVCVFQGELPFIRGSY